MKHKSILLLAVLLELLILPCLATEILVINSASRTLSRIDTESGTVNNSFAMLGLTPNLMDLDAAYIYVACSGDNAIQLLSRSTGAHIRYIPVAPSSNPYDVLKVGDFLYVSGLFTDKVYKISLQSYSVVGSLNVGVAPEGLCAAEGKLFVCNTGGYAANYAGSSVSVVDLASFSVIGTIPVWANPQYAVLWDGFLHVSCTGNWGDIPGKVDVLDISSLERVQRLDIGGHPGSLWINSAGTAYLGDGMEAGLYSYNADTYQVFHSSANPLNYVAAMVSGNSGLIALLDQNWTSSSVVRTYRSDFTPLGVYNVGLSSSDIVVSSDSPSANDDPLPVPRSALWPNPARSGAELHLAKALPAGAEIRIYNLRGRMLQKHLLDRSGASFVPEALSSGVYLYQIRQGSARSTGKLLIRD